jgi:hypothetical protein
MFKVAKLGIAIAAVLALIVPAAYAGVPNTTNSYYVPQAGTTTTPTTGAAAVLLFRACPNNDGGASLANNARIKVVVKDNLNNPIQGIAAADICMLFNGGTAAQGFSGVGADSVIANSLPSSGALCPDVRCVQADSATNVNGITYITLTGANAATPGVGVRNALRNWGHYDSNIPVFVLGFQLQGTLLESPTPTLGSYTLRVKNFDVSGGLATLASQSERVNAADVNLLISRFNKSGGATDYWLDYNNDNLINANDFNVMRTHLNHDCTQP